MNNFTLSLKSYSRLNSGKIFTEEIEMKLEDLEIVKIGKNSYYNIEDIDFIIDKLKNEIEILKELLQAKHEDVAGKDW